jgi:uncharacterized protein YbjT (DUF2867 family)
MSKTRILVAGASGYLGSFLVKEFFARGFAVRALVRSTEKARALAEWAEEIVVAQVMEAQSLREQRVAAGCDWVISTLGITRQRDGFSCQQVDYPANRNLLREAERAGVERFGFVAVLRGRELRRTRMVGAKERFVDELVASPIAHTVIRSTGFFSDMEEILNMARSGRAFLFGRGSTRFNPIHGADLAEVVVDAMLSGDSEVEVGGPRVFTLEEIVRLAFDVLRKPPRIVHVPDVARKTVLGVLPLLTRESFYGPTQFMLAAQGLDMTAPCYGRHDLEECFADRVSLQAEKEAVGAGL